MELNLRSPSASQHLTLSSAFPLEESKLRALQPTYHTQLPLLFLGISFSNSQVSGPRRSVSIRSSERANSHKKWAGIFTPTSLSPRSSSNSEKRSLGIYSTRCRECEETSGTASSSRFSGMENSAGHVVTHAHEHNGPTLKKKKVAIVWFKHDLRIDDHIGLTSALQYDHALPLFVFDSFFYAGWSEERLSSLFDSVADLRRSLQSIGSNLVIRKGRSKDVLLALAQEVGAVEIISEEETEQIWYDLVGSVSASLSVKSLSGQKTGVKLWRAPLYDLEDLKDVPDNYKDFTRLRREILPPMDAPTSLPALPANAEPGKLPSLVDFIAKCKSISREKPFGEVLMVAQSQPAESLLLGMPHSSNGNARQVTKTSNGAARKWAYLFGRPAEEMPFNHVWENRGLRGVEDMIPEVGGGGGTAALSMLRVYLKALECSRYPHDGMFKHIQELERRPGSSFRAIFNRAFELGTLSRRRVYCEVMKYERSRGGGRISPFGLSKRAASAAVEVKSIEWHEMIQRKSRDEGSENGLEVCSWRWRGYLIQYSTLGDEGPAVVLIHGFGAFWEHYRDNIRGLAEKGNRVWGLSMVGFGRSEKPPMRYTELVWAELVRDFIVEVVKEPVTLAGNSIGGYATCVVAGLWPSIVRSLVLLNSAGRVVPNYTALHYRKPREKSFIAKRGAQILMIYLQHLSKQLLQRCYPNKTARVDAWLQSQVMRPSFDPGATAVLESLFHLNPPLPMNFYIDRYNGEVLIIQGVRDPLHDATKRANALLAYCTNVTVRLLNAGHCPHDEVPDEVNALIHDWMRCSNSGLVTDTAQLALTVPMSQLLSNEDAAYIVKGGSRLMKAEWFSYFSR